MKVLVLCPSYGRPRLVQNAMACFLTQVYPQDECKMLVLDDADQLVEYYEGWMKRPQVGTNIQIVSVRNRYPSLPAKYNAMLSAEGVFQNDCYWDAVAVWDDDDIYLPWHIDSCVKALETYPYVNSCKPVLIYSLYNSVHPFKEVGNGRFHGSLFVRTSLLRSMGGWVQTKRADFDQQMIAACMPTIDTNPFSPSHLPSYIFRWGSTQAPHCQGLMSSPSNEDWYDRYEMKDAVKWRGVLPPKFDEETIRVAKELEPLAPGHFSRLNEFLKVS